MLNKLYRRKVVLFFIDLAIIWCSCGISYVIVRHTTDIPLNEAGPLFSTMLFVACNSLGLFLSGTYKKVWRYANVKDLFSAMVGILFGSLFCLALLISTRMWFSTLFCGMEFLVSLCAIIGSRLIYLYLNEFSIHNKNIPRENTMIVGGGQACQMLLTEILRVDDSRYLPVCIVDDDYNKISRKIQGVNVFGPIERIPDLCKRFDVKTIIFSVPSCEPQRRKEILDICFSTGCKVKTLPDVHRLMFDQPLLPQTTQIPIEDLLGRNPVIFDDENVSQFLRGKTCIITGGGGSIGSELCRQIAKYNPLKMIILDIYENNAYDIQQELIEHYGKSLDLVVEIASVRDYEKLEIIFKKHRPDIVFHAAAHKHVPLMEHNPEEAIKNNIFGTYNTAKLASVYKTKKFVMVSTDKAVNPTNVMGATKRCCEMIVQYMDEQSPDTEFVSVRFGNVLGSNGSVIPLFRRQIENGGPVTVTHPDINRFFMTIPEAVSLILQAGSMAEGGEIFVLDMGEPVKIVTLAENLIKLYGETPGERIKIKFTGLRPGEKLYEELLMNEEGLTATNNNKIYIGNQIFVDKTDFESKLAALHKLIDSQCVDHDKIVEAIKEIVPTFKPRSESEQEAGKTDEGL